MVCEERYRSFSCYDKLSNTPYRAKTQLSVRAAVSAFSDPDPPFKLKCGSAVMSLAHWIFKREKML